MPKSCDEPKISWSRTLVTLEQLPNPQRKQHAIRSEEGNGHVRKRVSSVLRLASDSRRQNSILSPSY